jgi:pyruvate dehydrogenase E1 component alpha subunit
MSVEDVHLAMEKVVEHARSGKGPYLLEMRTYRYKGHSMSDPAKYRTKEEVEHYKSEDPIDTVLKTITQKKLATEKEIESINERVKNVVEEAVKFSEESPFPDAAAVYEDVYVEADYPFIKD